MAQMPALNRQEISILFFVLFLMVLFEKNFNAFTKKNILLVIFGSSMTVSHYATSYVAVLLFAFVYFIWLFFRKTENKKIFSKIYQKLNLKEKGKSNREKYYLGGILILFLFIFNFLWSFQFTQTSDNLVYTIKMATINVGKIFKNEMISEQARLVLGGVVKAYTIKDVKEYSDDVSKEYQINKAEINFYSPEKYAKYAIEPRYAKNISPPSTKVTIINGLTRASQLSFEIFISYRLFLSLIFTIKKAKNK